ncbi:MAG: DUF4369 domain-containing protein [Flavobacterium sp.]|nr:DUF4369 domain-containing protein [Flavobacterium sp.]
MKRAVFAIAFIGILTACKKEPTGNLIIEGSINGLNKGTLYIQQLQDTVLVAIDSVELRGSSQFTTSIDIDSPEMLYLFLDRGVTNTIDNNLMFFAEPGKININTDLKTFYAGANITGSKNQDLYEEYKKVDARFAEKDLELTQEELLAFKENRVAETQLEREANLRRKYLHAINFALNNKEYEIAPYIALAEIPDANVKYLDTIQKSMSEKVANSKYGKMLTKHIAELKQAN